MQCLGARPEMFRARHSDAKNTCHLHRGPDPSTPLNSSKSDKLPGSKYLGGLSQEDDNSARLEASSVHQRSNTNNSDRSSAADDLSRNEPVVENDKLANFIETAERCRGQLLWVAIKLTSRRDEAEDIVQNALLKGFANLSKFRGDAQISTWLRTIVRNTALEYMRNQRGKVFVSLQSSAYPQPDDEILDLPDTRIGPEEYCALRESERLISSASARLSPIQRDVLRVCVFEELPHVRVATVLNVTLASLKSRVFRSKRALKMEMSAHKRDVK